MYDAQEALKCKLICDSTPDVHVTGACFKDDALITKHILEFEGCTYLYRLIQSMDI